MKLIRGWEGLGERAALLEPKSEAYALAMAAVHWGRPRGYCVAWLAKYGKPHLYRQIKAA